MKGQETQGGKDREGKLFHKPPPYRLSVFPKRLECKDARVIDGRHCDRRSQTERKVDVGWGERSDTLYAASIKSY